MKEFLKSRLRLMMFFQFFIWGSWYAMAGNYMRHAGMTSLIYLAYLASPIGSVLSPFFMGMIADRFFSVQKVMGTMHLLGGLFILAAPWFAEGSHASAPVFLVLLLLHMLCYMPTIGLATATAFHLLKEKEKEFPSVRVFGSAGWILAGFLLSYIWKADSSALPMQVAGLASLGMGFYSFTLPDTPPPGAGKKSSFRDLSGIHALSRLKSPAFIVFILSLLLTSMPLATYYAYLPLFLKSAGMATPGFRMTFGQMSEIIILLLMPWFLLKLGIKRVFIIGMCAWILRYAIFSYAAIHPVFWMMMLGILLHGICYDFVYIAGQIYLDQKATPEIRAQTQGLFVLVSYGIGQGLGTLLAGWIFNHLIGQSQVLADWRFFWLIPLLFASGVTLLFVTGFRDRNLSQRK